MPNRLQDRVALITGASSGIGRATALAFASEGAHVVCADLTEGSVRADTYSLADDKAGTTHSRIQAQGGKAVFVQCDTTDSASVKNAVATAVREFGRLDIMVNNAGVALEAKMGDDAPSIWNMDDEMFLTTQKINVHGVFYGTKHAAAQMVAQEPRIANASSGSTTDPKEQRGVILNASSIFGLVGTPGAAAYCTSKGAVANLTRSAALDCAPKGIRVNAVCPGFTASNMTDTVLSNPDTRAMITMAHPFRGLGRPEDIARTYLFLASDDAGWISGVSHRSFLHVYLVIL